MLVCVGGMVVVRSAEEGREAGQGKDPPAPPKPLKRAAFPSHPDAPPQARLRWLEVALLVSVGAVLWLCGVEGALRCVWMKNKGGHVTTKQNDEWLVAHEDIRARGLLATQNKSRLRPPPSQSRKRQGCEFVVVARVWPQASRCKGKQHKRRARATNPSKWCRSPPPARHHHPHDVAEAGRTQGAVWRRGRPRSGVSCVCMCV